MDRIPENARHPAPARDHRQHIGGWRESPSRGGREERLLEELLHVGIGEPRTPGHGVRPGTKGVEPACLWTRLAVERGIWGVSNGGGGADGADGGALAQERKGGESWGRRLAVSRKDAENRLF